MKSNERHKKHGDVKRPSIGDFHRNELAIIGAPCGEIQNLAAGVIRYLQGEFRVAYVDADHSNGDQTSRNELVPSIQYTDKIGYHRFDLQGDVNTFHRRPLLSASDIVLVNGNHFAASAQVVIIHESKKESLSRKLDRLTNVKLVLLQNETSEIYPFLLDHLPEDVAVMKLCEDREVASWIRDWMLARLPEMNGLVLSGGQSTRLGQDKTILDYHGKPQWEHLEDLMAGTCKNVHISVREGQDRSNGGSDRFIEDSFQGLGPYGGILSAFRHDPDKAWLVVATDLPMIDKRTLNFLIDRRNPSKIATAFLNPATGFPDPLCTIWEPRAYPVLLNFLSQGYSCPRKVLINSDVEVIEVPDANWLLNVNTPEDLKRARTLLA